MPTVTFLPWSTAVDVAAGTTVLTAAAQAGVSIPTACVGKATCGLCRVKIVAGAEHLPPFSPVEAKHLGNIYFINKLRLSCQVAISHDVTVLVPDAK
ncbi:MAG: 2Fe-2S iron-sulfur cluster-binding protein [Myxococcota bacterium]